MLHIPHYQHPVLTGIVSVKPQHFAVTFNERMLGLHITQTPFWVVARMSLRDGSIILPMILEINGMPVVRMDVALHMINTLPRPIKLTFALPAGYPILRECVEPSALDLLAGVACGGVTNLHKILNTRYQPILPRL